jgi:hypothetical protein
MQSYIFIQIYIQMTAIIKPKKIGSIITIGPNEERHLLGGAG